jgi:SAM-dependent methyltransferase
MEYERPGDRLQPLHALRRNRATAYDEDHSTDDELAEAVQQAVATLRGHYPPAVLDVGCGTGRALDLGVTTTDRYAGVDPSRPMLNQLVRKHPDVAALYPMKIEQALATDTLHPGSVRVRDALAGRR